MLAEKVPTIAFFGDSVTQGCFELTIGDAHQLDTVFAAENGYPRDFRRILSLLYPNVPINVIHAGISGDGTNSGVRRLERDVLSYHPDLTVVCYGLNDVHRGMDFLSTYTDNLATIFDAIKAQGGEIIFMTPNMMNTDVRGYDLTPDQMELYQKIAFKTADIQNNGMFDAFIKAAKQTAKKHGVPVCDVYAKWKKLHENGVSVTHLLSNQINHPVREMHWLFAFALIDTIFN